MPDWLEDASANRHIKTYVKDFLDVSGNLTVRRNEDYKWNTYGQVLSGNYESDNTVQFGASTHMDASGTTIVVGAHQDNTGADNNGAVYVYRYDTTAEIWYQLGNTIGSPTTTASTASFGRMVQISANGNRIAVADSVQDDIYFYDYNSGTNTWDSAGSIVQAEHGLSEVRTNPGLHLSGDGNTIMFCDNLYNTTTGMSLVYRNTTGTTTWTKIGEFVGNTTNRERQGIAISYDGNRICYSDPTFDNDSTGATLTNAGRALIFDYTGNETIWTRVGGLIYSDIEEDYFGITGDMTGDGSIVLLSGLGGGGTGSVRVYQYDANVDGSWNQLGTTITGIEHNSWGRGARISDDGITLVAGHQYYDDEALEQGALYVYKYINGDWEQQGEVITGTYNNITWNDKLGYIHTYAINGDGTKIVGGVISADLNTTDSGAVQVFQWSKNAPYTNPMLDISGGTMTVWGGAEENPNNWDVNQLGVILYGTTEIVNNGRPYANFGASPCMNQDGSVIACGAPYSGSNELSGTVVVYKYRNGHWSKIGNQIMSYWSADDSSTKNSRAGTSVELDNSGTTVAFGTRTNSNNGTIEVYKFVNGDWTQKGTPISESGASYFGGLAVSINGHGNIVAGMSRFNGVGVYQYVDASGDWYQMGSNMTDISMPNDLNVDGKQPKLIKLSEDGTIIAIGDAEDSSDAGRVSVYKFTGTLSDGSWNLLGNHIYTPTSNDQEQFGRTVSLSSDGYTVAFSSSLYNGGDGCARVMQYSEEMGDWTQLGYDIRQNQVSLDAGSAYLGYDVALSGDAKTLMVGNHGYSGSPNSGLAYIFKYIDGAWKEVTYITSEGSLYLGAWLNLSRDGKRCVNGNPGINYGWLMAHDIVNRPDLKIEKDLVRFGGNTFIPNTLSIGTDGSTHYAPIENVPLHLHRTELANNAVPTMKVYRLECTGEIDDNFGIRIEYKIERRKVDNIADVNTVHAAYTDVIINNAPGTSERGRWFKRTRNNDTTISLELRYNGYTYPQTGRSSTSDDRLKKNETLITNASETIMKLSPQLYEKYNNFDCSGDFMMESGLIAQDIWYNTPELRHLVVFPDDRTNYDIQPLPEGVNTTQDIQNDPDYTSLGWGTKPVHILYSGLIPYLIKSNQEQQEILDTEKAKTELVESEIATMEPEVATLTTQMADLLSRISVLENK